MEQNEQFDIVDGPDRFAVIRALLAPAKSDDRMLAFKAIPLNSGTQEPHVVSVMVSTVSRGVGLTPMGEPQSFVILGLRTVGARPHTVSQTVRIYYDTTERTGHIEDIPNRTHTLLADFKTPRR